MNRSTITIHRLRPSTAASLVALALALSASGCFLTYGGMQARYPYYAFPVEEPPADAAPATVRVETLKIPTLRIEDLSYTPPPFAMDDVAMGYPYQRTDRWGLEWVSRRVEERAYPVVVLENEYLKVTMLPRYGGRLFDAVFKPTGRHVFYSKNELRPYELWGCGKEWMFASGGLRFEFPDFGHDPDTEEPWDCTTATFPNGTASVTFSHTEVRHGMQIRNHVSLDPGRSWIRLNVELVNPHDYPQDASFWVICGILTTKGLEFVIPTEYAIEHGGAETFHWPTNRGRDWSYMRNWLGGNWSFFALHWKGRFSGIYDHEDEYGVVRCAPAEATPGLKLWADTGSIRRYYASIYGGITQTMEEWVTFSPGEVRSWEEVWYPLDHTKGLTDATREVAASLHRDGDKLVLGLMPTRQWKGAKVALTRGGAALFEKSLDLTPRAAFVETIDLKGAGPSVQLVVSAADGRTLLKGDFELDKLRPPFGANVPNR
jgi:hypothetical protein